VSTWHSSGSLKVSPALQGHQLPLGPLARERETSKLWQRRGEQLLETFQPGC
jgi:hypothetical protein